MPELRAHLEILRDGRGSRSVPIGRTPFRIGSDPSADLTITEPGVAPSHAQIILLAGAYRVVPGSPGSEVLLDDALAPPEGLALRHAALIGLGRACRMHLRFLLAGAGPVDRSDRLTTLMEIARTITSSLAVEEVLKRVLDGAVRFSGAERGYLFLRDGERLAPWTSPQDDPAKVQVSLSVAEEVARTGRPVYRDLMGDLEGRSMTESIVRLRLQAILCLPLAVRQDTIGVVYLDSRKPLPHHGPDLPWLEALAGLAAVAIQNSRLIEEKVHAARTLVIGQMARAIVHDLRSPLASIRGLADLLLERSPESEASRPHLRMIVAEVDRLTRLTGDLLQFSKEAPPLNCETVSPADLVRGILRPLAARLGTCGVQVELDLDEGIRTGLDSSKMIRVLHNLIANSLEAMPRGGLLALRCWEEGGRCLLSVRDTGLGMTEDVRRRVFEPFFSHGKREGTGLGMAIVGKIVEEHGGLIRIESAPGQGTTVVLTLGAATREPTGSPRPIASSDTAIRNSS